MLMSACQVFDCPTCDYLTSGVCPGCLEGNTRRAAAGEQTCAIYRCVEMKGLATCAECTSPVCSVYDTLTPICPLRPAETFGVPVRLAPPRAEAASAAEERRLARGPAARASRLSDRTLERMRWYLGCLEDLIRERKATVMSSELGKLAGVKAALVRRDLSRLGQFGSHLGYDVEELKAHIRRSLRLDEQKSIVWVGARRLADEVPLIHQMRTCGLHLAAVFDYDSALVGSRIERHVIMPMSDLPQAVARLSVTGAVIAVPSSETQRAADDLAAAGVKAILNLSPATVAVPPGVYARNADVSADILCLACHSHPAVMRL